MGCHEPPLRPFFIAPELRPDYSEAVDAVSKLSPNSLWIPENIVGIDLQFDSEQPTIQVRAVIELVSCLGT